MAEQSIMGVQGGNDIRIFPQLPQFFHIFSLFRMNLRWKATILEPRGFFCYFAANLQEFDNFWKNLAICGTFFSPGFPPIFAGENTLHLEF